MIKHNTIDMISGRETSNACIFFQPSSGTINGATIDGNLFDGGGYSVYLERSKNVSVTNNRFGEDYKYSQLNDTDSPDGVVAQGNIDDVTGGPI